MQDYISTNTKESNSTQKQEIMQELGAFQYSTLSAPLIKQSMRPKFILKYISKYGPMRINQRYKSNTLFIY